MTVTANLKLEIVPFNTAPWHDLVNGNFQNIDAIIGTIFGFVNLKGKWQNSTSVVTGDRYFDETTGKYYEVLVNHVTAAQPTTFLEDRVANPTYWMLLADSTSQSAVISAAESKDAAILAQQAAEAAAASVAGVATAAEAARDEAVVAKDAALSYQQSAQTAQQNAMLYASDANTAKLAAEAAAALAPVNAANYVSGQIGQTIQAQSSFLQLLSNQGAVQTANVANGAITFAKVASDVKDLALTASTSKFPVSGAVKSYVDAAVAQSTGYPFGAWHPYDSQFINDGNEGILYQPADGSVTGVQNIPLEEGYDYLLRWNGSNANISGGARFMGARFFNALTSSWTTWQQLGPLGESSGNLHTGEALFRLPNQGSYFHYSSVGQRTNSAWETYINVLPIDYRFTLMDVANTNNVIASGPWTQGTVRLFKRRML